MPKTRDIVAEIAAKVPRDTHGSRPWWERAPDKHRATLDAIHAAWHSGTFGPQKRPAARVISQALAEMGIRIGEQGVVTWLRLPPKS
jgi:hypothetical protein